MRVFQEGIKDIRIDHLSSSSILTLNTAFRQPWWHKGSLKTAESPLWLEVTLTVRLMYLKPQIPVITIKWMQQKEGGASGFMCVCVSCSCIVKKGGGHSSLLFLSVYTRFYQSFVCSINRSEVSGVTLDSRCFKRKNERKNERKKEERVKR